MSVTGLPAAVEASLSALLAKETLTSWKVDGTEGQTVVVLRFATGQPLPNYGKAQCRWRRKPPSQLCRDKLRLARYHEFRNACPTNLSAELLEPRETSNPCDSADIPVKLNCETTEDEQPSVTSDPVTSDHLPNNQLAVGDASSESADSTNCCATEDRPSTGHDDHPSHDNLPAGLRDFTRKLDQLDAVMKSCLEKMQGGDTLKKDTVVRDNCAEVDSAADCLPTPFHPKDRLAPPGSPVRVRPPRVNPAGDHGGGGGRGGRDPPALARHTRGQKARKKQT